VGHRRDIDGWGRSVFVQAGASTKCGLKVEALTVERLQALRTLSSARSGNKALEMSRMSIVSRESSEQLVPGNTIFPTSPTQITPPSSVLHTNLSAPMDQPLKSRS
jgi:hypothetical protein